MFNNSKSLIEQCVRNGKPISHTPVIDFHCHFGASNDYYYIPRNSVPQVVKYLDRYGVDHIVTFAINVSSDPATGNQLQYQAAADYPERISALTYLHAKFPNDWVPLLKEGVKNGSRGIKLISQYQNVNECDIDWSPAFDFARDKNWVVLHHFWDSPERLERWAKAYPSITFIEGHSATFYKKVIEKYDNVYQCTCACFVNWFHSFMDVYKALPVEKILYGSDSLDLDLGTGISPIALADIPEKDKEKILGTNAVALMKKLKWNVSIAKK